MERILNPTVIRLTPGTVTLVIGATDDDTGHSSARACALLESPPAIVITDERADRMRMMAPVAAVDTLEPTGPPLTRHGDS